MKQDVRLRTLLIFLMVAAVVSFSLCVFSDVRMNITHVSLPDELAVALSWLVGHGLHGAIVVLLPVVYFLVGQPSSSVPPQSEDLLSNHYLPK